MVSTGSLLKPASHPAMTPTPPTITHATTRLPARRDRHPIPNPPICVRILNASQTKFNYDLTIKICGTSWAYTGTFRVPFGAAAIASNEKSPADSAGLWS
jgi:hypothetical protein